MKTKVWAHRGASGYAPENTLEAFGLAVKQQADGIELDVQLSRDGELVVIHDELVGRVSGEAGYVKDYTLSELKRLNVNRTCPECENAEIPTLREVYELMKPSGLTINVELKTGVFFYPGIEEKVLELGAAMGLEDRLWYSSFNHRSLVTLKKLNPSVRTGILYSDGWINVPEYAEHIQAEALHPEFYGLRYPGFLSECRAKGLKLHVWTVDDEELMKAMVQDQVDAIITDYPDRARKVLKGAIEKP